MNGTKVGAAMITKAWLSGSNSAKVHALADGIALCGARGDPIVAGPRPTTCKRCERLLRARIAQAAREIAIEETELHTWFERDRAHVELREKVGEETLLELWDEAVAEAVEDGYLPQIFSERIPSERRKLHEAMYRLWKERR